MEESRKIKNNLIAVIFADILIVFLYFCLIYFVRGPQNEEFLASINGLKEVEGIQSNYSMFTEALKNTEGERKTLNEIIVNKKTAASFIEDLEKLAEGTNVELVKTINLEKQFPQVKENMLRFTVRAKGKLSDVYYFMNMLEALPYKVRFKKIALGTSSENISAGVAAVPVIATKGGGKTNIVINEPMWSSEAVFELLSYVNE